MKDYKQTAQSWLTGNFDDQTKAEVKHLMDTDPVALEDAFYRNLEFGTGGLRGIMGAGTNRMNKYTVGMATQGLANYIKAHVQGEASVCISHDSRNNSRLFAEISAQVLSNNGIKVYLFESLRPTPELSYSIRLKKATAGIMVTASHNPKEYNGYKVFWSDGGQITAPVDKDIVAEVAKIEDPALPARRRRAPGCHRNYGRRCGRMLPPGPALPHAVPGGRRQTQGPQDCVYAPSRLRRQAHAGGPEAHRLYQYYPCAGAGRKRRQLPHRGLPQPGRTRRHGHGHNNGKMVQLTGNQTWSFLTYYILKRWQELGKLNGNQYCVKTIVTTELIAAICKSFGVKCYNVLTGFKYIAEIQKLQEGKSEFICGGEESYGFNLGSFVRDKCAQVAGCAVAECAAWAAEQGLTLYQLLQKVYKEYGLYVEKMVYIVRKGKSGAEEIQQIMADYRACPPKEIAGSPLVKVLDYNKPEETGLPKSNVLQFYNAAGDVVTVRPSGTEPKIKFYFGAKGDDAPAKIEQLKAQFIK